MLQTEKALFSPTVKGHCTLTQFNAAYFSLVVDGDLCWVLCIAVVDIVQEVCSECSLFDLQRRWGPDNRPGIEKERENADECKLLPITIRVHKTLHQ